MVKELEQRFRKQLPKMFLIVAIVLAGSSLIRTGTFTDIDLLEAFALVISLSLVEAFFDHYGIGNRKR